GLDTTAIIGPVFVEGEDLLSGGELSAAGTGAGRSRAGSEAESVSPVEITPRSVSFMSSANSSQTSSRAQTPTAAHSARGGGGVLSSVASALQRIVHI